MDANVRGFSSSTHQSTQEMHIKKGPWTSEEDSMLTNHVITQGEGRWNSVARCSGLKRTGKSCRLRWLNYLRPNVRHGNMTLQEQLLILELQSRWGNRWSKIAQQLPGRTDNEIKNYWRTRVQKQAKQLKFDVNSQQFRDAMRYVWIPHLSRKIEAASESTTTACTATTSDQRDMATANLMPKLSGASSETWDTHVGHVSPFSGLTDYNNLQGGSYLDSMQNGQGLYPENCPSPWGCLDIDAFEEHRNG